MTCRIIRVIEFLVSVKGNDGMQIRKHFITRDPEDPDELKWNELCVLIRDLRRMIVYNFGIKDTQLYASNNEHVGGSTQVCLTSSGLIRKDELSHTFQKLRSLLIESIKETNAMKERKSFFIRTVVFSCSDVEAVELDTESDAYFPGCRMQKDI